VATAIWWLRRDLRLADNPALAAAAATGEVLPLFVLDDRLRAPSGPARLTFLYRCLRDLDDATGGRLVVRTGPPEQVLPQLAQEVDAGTVHVSADYGPYGGDRDRRVERALAAAGRELVATGSPYAVSPGRLRTASGGPFRVFTPYYRAWLAHGWRRPATLERPVRWVSGVAGDGLPAGPEEAGGVVLPAAGEAAATQALDRFLERVTGYAAGRNVPGADATSRLSPYLKFGCLHPRTVLARLSALPPGPGAEAFQRELAWREFYAHVLAEWPESARNCLQPAFTAMVHNDGPAARAAFDAWATGRTGYPLVDAGMRELLASGWMHNRVRMLTASFLVKDLHLDWRWGARHFLRLLVDGDLASNNHGWQWVAGCGTDAAPYYRVFNPVAQSRRFDPDGTYLRRWVPELRDVPAPAIHEPWSLDPVPAGYPAPMVVHDEERREALRRWADIRGGGTAAPGGD
jgi:deoxyribodipyrimidine photo-lyase